jgi:hypothetical protein
VKEKRVRVKEKRVGVGVRVREMGQSGGGSFEGFS